MAEIDTAVLDKRIKDAAPASGEGTMDPVVPTSDRQELADELGDGDPLDERIADAADYVPEELEETDADTGASARDDLAGQLNDKRSPLERRIEDADDAPG